MFKSGPDHPKWVDRDKLLQHLKTLNIGTLVISGERINGSKYRTVEATCSFCHEVRIMHVDNILSGKSTNCRCTSGVKHGGTEGAKRYNHAARVLSERYDAILQRCCNTDHEWYPDYGGRGIELKFKSRHEFISWCLENLPHENNYKSVQIDRRNNDGHYEPGNLRLVSQAVNLRNTRRNVYCLYRGMRVVASDLWHLLRRDYPGFRLSKGRVVKLISNGVSPDDILLRQARGPRNGRELPQYDPAVVALYDDGAVGRG